VHVDWLALFKVSAVTIGAAVAIVGLMCLANWFLTPPDEAETAPRGRRLAGGFLIGVMGLIIIGGLVLIIPYFH
jgi:hypothetical protein